MLNESCVFALWFSYLNTSLFSGEILESYHSSLSVAIHTSNFACGECSYQVKLVVQHSPFLF